MNRVSPRLCCPRPSLFTSRVTVTARDDPGGASRKVQYQGTLFDCVFMVVGDFGASSCCLGDVLERAVPFLVALHYVGVPSDRASSLSEPHQKASDCL